MQLEESFFFGFAFITSAKVHRIRSFPHRQLYFCFKKNPFWMVSNKRYA